MRQLLFTIIMLTLPLFAKAQFFSFGFDDDFFGLPNRYELPEAEYNGTQGQMESFIKSNYKNPANQQNVNGKIIVQCIIDEKGDVVDTRLLQGVRDSYNREAIRVATLLKFKPLKNVESEADGSGNGKSTKPSKGKSSKGKRSSENDGIGNGSSSDQYGDGDSNNHYRRNQRQSDNRRKYDVTFPIKKGKLNFLNIATIEV